MAAPAPIDELRHRYAAQPRRYLAPLANALRRSGALEEAVTMLRAQLAEYPDHLTGYVVLGHALFDTGALAEAQTAFESARALDPGNRVVLRQLGEIASLAGDRDTARLWFERLRAAEPYADDVAAQLGGAATEPPDVEEEVGVGSGTQVTPVQEVTPAHDERPSAAAQAFVPEPFATDAFELLEFDAAPLDPVVGLDVAPAATPVELQATRDGVAPTPAAAASDAVDDDPPSNAATAALDQITAGPFATETMAGLLAAQGHTEQAIALYERLTAERPADGALRERLQALRGESDHVGVAAGAAADAAPERDAAAVERALDGRRAVLYAAAFADLASRPVDVADVTPAEPARARGAPVLAADDTAISGDTDPFADVSFDRFFAAPIATPPEGVGAATAEDADLARFDAWLRDVAA